MPAPQQQSGGGGDNSLAPIWISVLIFAALGLIWWFYSAQIINFIFTIKYYEAWLLSWIIPDKWAKNLSTAMNFIQNTKANGYDGVTLKEVYSVCIMVGEYLRFPVIISFAAIAIYLYFHSPILHYKKTYDMKSLRQQEVADWPQISPVAKLDLVKEDIHKGPWAMSLTPLEFAKKLQLLVVQKQLPEEGSLQSKAILIATINRDEARKVFAHQLGPMWRGIDALPIHTKALFAVFAARIAGERDEPHELLMQIARSTLSGKLNFTGVDKLLKKHREHKIVKKIITVHAYVLTVMASMLLAARQDGVVASADFLWLKVVDRKLWYMLNTMGRQTPFPEVSGPYAHWLGERELGRKLNSPLIEEAVNALEKAMKEIIYKEDEEN